MPYIESTVNAGKIREVTKYHTRRYESPKRPRGKNEHTTTIQQAKINERSALRKLYLLINANFKPNDLYLTLTYEKNIPTPEEAKGNLSKFLRKLRDKYKKLGGVLKYIGITEHHKRRIHHHLLINKIGIGISHIKKFWQFGFSKVQLFTGEPEDADRLANYFIKESNNAFNTDDKVHGVRWVASKNLIHPIPDQVEKKVVHASSWREEPKPPKGYYVAFVHRGFTEQQYPYQFYRLVKIDPDEPDS